MSTTYNVVVGDTLELVSRKVYGTEIAAGRIRRANPGLVEPLSVGTVLVIPSDPSVVVNQTQLTETDDPDEVGIFIDGDRFRFWDHARFIRSMDSMDTLVFSAPFEMESAEFRETFRPFSYKPLAMTVGGVTMLTGTMVGVDPLLETKQKTVSISGYSLPGVLDDCTAPASSYPLEFNGQGLQEVATTLAEPFGLGVDYRLPMTDVFTQIALSTDSKVLSFIANLARQRNGVLTNNEMGQLLVWQSVAPGSPVARLHQGSSPVESVVPLFNPQNYFSHITGINPVAVDDGGSQYTGINSRLQGVVRPITFTSKDTEGANIIDSVRAKAGRMLGGAASYSVRVSTWRDPQGQLWTPNTTVMVLAISAMIYQEYEFIIRSVEFETDKDTRIATLNLVIPGTFSGVIPESLPWEG